MGKKQTEKLAPIENYFKKFEVMWGKINKPGNINLYIHCYTWFFSVTHFGVGQNNYMPWLTVYDVFLQVDWYIISILSETKIYYMSKTAFYGLYFSKLLLLI